MGLSFLPLHVLTMTQATKPSLTLLSSKTARFKCNNTYVNTELIESLPKENKTISLLPEDGWNQINEEIKRKYFYLTNMGMVLRELTPEEFAKYDCGSVHKIDHQYYTVLGIGYRTYYNNITDEYLKVQITWG